MPRLNFFRRHPVAILSDIIPDISYIEMTTDTDLASMLKLFRNAVLAS
jgi:hypothetical protein